VLFHTILLHSLDTLMVTRHLLQLITRIVVSGGQPGPSDGHVTIDDHAAALAGIVRDAKECGFSVQAAAAFEVVRWLASTCEQQCHDSFLSLCGGDIFSPANFENFNLPNFQQTPPFVTLFQGVRGLCCPCDRISKPCDHLSWNLHVIGSVVAGKMFTLIVAFMWL
jgi:hypothetical protein